MSSLPLGPTIAALPKGIVFSVGGVLVLLLVVIWTLSRRRHVIIGESEAVRMAVIQLGRIADSLERISLNMLAEPKAPAAGKESDAAYPVLHH